MLLDQPAPDVATALAHLGYVQIDPINVCGRMHDLILRNRVRAYREGDLMRHLHGHASPPETLTANAGPPANRRPPETRTAFEHHLPHRNILVAFPVEAWPHLLASMRQRARTPGPWSGKLTPRERDLAQRILAEIAARGPLTSDDIDDPRRGTRVWGASTLVKSTLQKLFFHGRVLISHRIAQRRVYDLPERVLPPSILSEPAPAADATARWLLLLKLRQRRLAFFNPAERALVEDVVQPVRLADGPVVHCLRSDLPLLDALSASAPDIEPNPPDDDTLLLAPLDPLIYDRRLTRVLWDFEYTWEVYTPAAKRVRGYYALPVLVGDEIVGYIDPKADRAKRKLEIVSRSIRRGHRAASAIAGLARFLGLKR